ncbi:hypothetical protein [Pseudoalteromonas viridis]|uniref:DUF1566 domain-containing protein n=1 Tax=Pseudoalteromonas viridis TaxID=339617 RepID=A0ABX7V3M7_9GAMM|nr:hypothetical protein [Pseudoalteromonas viridis]QTL35504.1 hypothetical protein J5X90_00025 [Pseudoalteromonas viridis]
MLHRLFIMLLVLGCGCAHAMEIQGPRYLQPGDTAMFSIADHSSYDQFHWQHSRFYGDIMTGGEKQQLAQLHLDETSTDRQIVLHTYGMRGWNYDSASIQIQVRDDKPVLSGTDIQGPAMLSKGKAGLFSLSALPADALISWQVADSQGDQRGITVTPDEQQVSVLVKEGYQGVGPIHIYAFVTSAGWQHRFEFQASLQQAQPRPTLSLVKAQRYTSLVPGKISALLDNVPDDAQISYHWSLLTPPYGGDLTLQNADASEVVMLASQLTSVQKATLALAVDIVSPDLDVTLKKEFELTITPNLPPQIDFQLPVSSLWFNEVAQLAVMVTEAEQETYSLRLEHANSDALVITPQSPGLYQLQATSNENSTEQIIIVATDQHGHESRSVVELALKKLPQIRFTHAASHYALSQIPLRAEVDIAASEIKDISWQQSAGERVVLDTQVALDSGFTASPTPQTYQFELNITLSEQTSVAATTLLTTEEITQLNDSGDRRLIDEQGQWLRNRPDSLALPGLDAQTGRDSDVSLIKHGAGPDGFDFSFISAQGTEVAAYSPAASCLKDNLTGWYWLLKTASQYPLEQQLPLSAQCDSTPCSIRGLVTQLNQQQLCGVADWRLPTATQALSVMSLNDRDPVLSWLSNDEAGDFNQYLHLRTATTRTGADGEPQVYVISWFGSEMSSQWQNPSRSLHFFLIGGQ